MLPALNNLENTQTSILYSIPLGKPNPNQKCTVEIDDSRERVTQSAQKGNTCWYYAMTILRKRIGNNHDSALAENRKVESICSNYKKDMGLLADKCIIIEDVIQVFQILKESRNIFSSDDQIISVKNARILLSMFESSNEDDENINLLKEYLKSFIDNPKRENFIDHMYYVISKDAVQLLVEFTKNLNISSTLITGLKECVENLTISPCRIFSLSHELFIDFVAKQYGLKKTDWNPEKNIDELIEILKKNGPFSVGGFFGKSFYESEPVKLSQKIDSRDIFGWKPGSKRIKSIRVAHSIVIIGAKKTTNATFVFFLDPTDGSNPKDISSQKIYVISYKNLQENAASKILPDEPNFYGYHGNFAKH